MATFEIDEKQLGLLHELADMQHPHMKGDNHTRTLINKVYKRERLSVGEAFDCGKYYQRMLEQLRQFDKEKDLYGDYLHAVLVFKWQIH